MNALLCRTRVAYIILGSRMFSTGILLKASFVQPTSNANISGITLLPTDVVRQENPKKTQNSALNVLLSREEVFSTVLAGKIVAAAALPAKAVGQKEEVLNRRFVNALANKTALSRSREAGLYPFKYTQQERNILVATYSLKRSNNDGEPMSLRAFHSSLADTFLVANNSLAASPRLVSPTSVVTAWWKCRFCAHEFRRRLFDHCFVFYGGECPKCHRFNISRLTPLGDSEVSSKSASAGAERSRLLTRVGNGRAFATKETARNYTDIPFLRDHYKTFAPILASQWLQHCTPLIKTLSAEQKCKKDEDPVLSVSHKLDGVRCIAVAEQVEISCVDFPGIYISNGSALKIHFFSRTGTLIEGACDHLVPLLGPIFAYDIEIVLDGELYVHLGSREGRALTLAKTEVGERPQEFDFQQVISAVRTHRDRASPETRLLQKQLEYHVFDLMYFAPQKRLALLSSDNVAKDKRGGAARRVATVKHLSKAQDNKTEVLQSAVVTGFEDRFSYLCRLLELAQRETSSKNLQIVPCSRVRSSKVLAAMEQAVGDGFEGIMIRRPDGGYAHGRRSTNLLKFKHMADEEYEIVDVVEGKGKFSGAAGAVICKSDNSFIKNKRDGERGKKKQVIAQKPLMQTLMDEEDNPTSKAGRKSGRTAPTQFSANPSMTLEQRKQMWKNKHKYIGQVGTVQFQELSREGIPRFPVLKCVRGAKDGSNWL